MQSDSSAAASPRDLIGKTVQAVAVKPYATGVDGAMEAIDITTTDGETLTLYAGSYAIPEEACIYATY